MNLFLGIIKTNELLKRITINPEQCLSRSCIREMRIRVTGIINLFVGGLSSEQALKELPNLKPEDLQATFLIC